MIKSLFYYRSYDINNLSRVVLIPLSMLKGMLIIILLMGSILIYYKVMNKGTKNIEEVEI